MLLYLLLSMTTLQNIRCLVEHTFIHAEVIKQCRYFLKKATTVDRTAGGRSFKASGSILLPQTGMSPQ